MANAFNDYFSNIGCEITSSIPSVNKCPLNYLNKSCESRSFFLSPATVEETELEILKSNISKSVGPYSIPTCLIKCLYSCLSRPLVDLYNWSFQCGIVPDKFKVARVIPIFKSGDQTCLGNYRPISLLSLFNKILEKLMYRRLISYIEKKNILFQNQFGFQGKHSTTQAVILMTDRIQKAIEDKQYSCGIFLDFSKAFDTVDHQILLHKLEAYGIRGIVNEWLKSYLQNRRQFTTTGSMRSEEKIVKYGVPQKSALGPLLFLLYINDFKNCSDLFDFHSFADDSNLFFAHKNLKYLEQLVNLHLSNIHTWLCANKLSLNIKKTNYVIFYPSQKKLVYNPKLFLNQMALKQEKCVKYLSIYVDSHLNWKIHVNNISEKIKRSIGILLKVRYYVTPKILLQLYYSLTYPFLTYGVLLWGNTYTSTLNH